MDDLRQKVLDYASRLGQEGEHDLISNLTFIATHEFTGEETHSEVENPATSAVIYFMPTLRETLLGFTDSLHRRVDDEKVCRIVKHLLSILAA